MSRGNGTCEGVGPGHGVWGMGHGGLEWEGVVNYRIYGGLRVVRGYLGNPKGIWASRYTASGGF